jgi:hypothetical protein
MVAGTVPVIATIPVVGGPRRTWRILAVAARAA